MGCSLVSMTKAANGCRRRGSGIAQRPAEPAHGGTEMRSILGGPCVLDARRWLVNSRFSERGFGSGAGRHPAPRRTAHVGLSNISAASPSSVNNRWNEGTREPMISAGWYAPPWGVETPRLTVWCRPLRHHTSLTLRVGEPATHVQAPRC